MAKGKQHCTSQQTHRIAKLKVIFYCSCKFFSLYFLTRRRRRRCMFDVYVHIIAAAHTFLCLQAMVISLLLSPIHLFVSFIRIRTFMPISCSQRENELEKNEWARWQEWEEKNERNEHTEFQTFKSRLAVGFMMLLLLLLLLFVPLSLSSFYFLSVWVMFGWTLSQMRAYAYTHAFLHAVHTTRRVCA